MLQQQEGHLSFKSGRNQERKRGQVEESGCFCACETMPFIEGRDVTHGVIFV